MVWDWCSILNSEHNVCFLPLFPTACSMLLAVLSVCVVGSAVLYALFFWLIPAAVQYNASAALLWHDVIVERFLDFVTGSTRPQVTLWIVFVKPAYLLYVPMSTPESINYVNYHFYDIVRTTIITVSKSVCSSVYPVSEGFYVTYAKSENIMQKIISLIQSNLELTYPCPIHFMNLNIAYYRHVAYHSWYLDSLELAVVFNTIPTCSSHSVSWEQCKRTPPGGTLLVSSPPLIISAAAVSGLWMWEMRKVGKVTILKKKEKKT